MRHILPITQLPDLHLDRHMAIMSLNHHPGREFDPHPHPFGLMVPLHSQRVHELLIKFQHRGLTPKS